MQFGAVKQKFPEETSLYAINPAILKTTSTIQDDFERNEFLELFSETKVLFLMEFKALAIDLHNYLKEINIKLTEINNEILTIMKNFKDSEELSKVENQNVLYIIDMLNDALKVIPNWQFIISENAFNVEHHCTKYFATNHQKLIELGFDECQYLIKMVQKSQKHLNALKKNNIFHKKLNKLKDQLKTEIVCSKDVYDSLKCLNDYVQPEQESGLRRKWFLKPIADLQALKAEIKKIKESVNDNVDCIRTSINTLNKEQHELWRKITNCIENNVCSEKKFESFLSLLGH